MIDPYDQKRVGKMDKGEMFETIEAVYNKEISQQKRWLQEYIEECRPYDYVESDGTPVPDQHQFFHESSFVKDVCAGLEYLASKERQLELLLSMKEQG